VTSSVRIARPNLERKEKAKIQILAGPPPMPNDTATWVIALDGGTTNTRARLMHGRETVVVARRAVGARDSVLSDKTLNREAGTERVSATPQPGRVGLVQTVKALLDEVLQKGHAAVLKTSSYSEPRPEYVVIAGMLGSELGLRCVPHVAAPAGLDELARGVAVSQLPEIAPLWFYFIPGVSVAVAGGQDGWFQADVMRGEESETWGAYRTLLVRGDIHAGQSQVFLWPGSHTKLVEVDSSGRISRSQTSLAGEMIQAVAQHTVVSASLPVELPDQVDWDAAASGRRALARDGLGRAAFLVRVAALTESLNPRERASFWMGAVVADDVIHLTRHVTLRTGACVWVGGRPSLRSLYTAWLAEYQPVNVVALDDTLADSASALGAVEIAARRRYLESCTTQD
jgi:2-dehydro-3-deoxygalactonokinase